MRMIVRQVYSAPDVLIHDSGNGAEYTDVALYADGLRLAGYDCNAERFRDKAAGYESWTFRDLTAEDRDPIVIALTWEV